MFSLNLRQKLFQLLLMFIVLVTAAGMLVGESQAFIEADKLTGTAASVASEHNGAKAVDTAEIKDYELPFSNLQHAETVEVVATGYYAGVESTGKRPGHPGYGITYSGVKVRREKNGFSTIAADPKVFPIGTLMYIPGYGFGVVADTGGAIKGKKIDLYFHTKDQVYSEWGKRNVNVYVLKRGEGKVTEAMMDQLNSGQAIPVDFSLYP
ncbi:Cell wall-binding protein yocH precursor [Chlamydia abortus]|uniref:3D domain-containing protein n=2 Tax=Paenibacillus TaxID=44249 RepID=A0ABW3D9S9_9BACL|nr:Cell wall-binding protein yocH precursor [Chlamydia abortus]